MKSVVVIGGGFAGSLAAKKLQKKFKVTLIDSKDYFEFTPSILRSLIEPGHLEKIEIKHKDYLKNTEVIIGKVSKVMNDYVVVENKGRVNFDYLVIASGSSYNSPFKEQQVLSDLRIKNIEKYHDKLEKSEKIVIVGGGPVGVELAGEIVHRYGYNKKLSLFHSQERLLQRNSEKASQYAYEWLNRKGAHLFLSDKVKQVNKNEVVTEKGEKIESDLVFVCNGIKSNTDFMKRHFSHILNKNGQVKVNNFLQASHRENIFVAGDANDVMQEKTAQNAQLQAEVVVKNIFALEKGRPLVQFVPRVTPLVISLGKYSGIYINKEFVMTGIIPAFMKWAIEKMEIFRRRY